MESGGGAFGAGKAGVSFDPIEFLKRPQVILRLVNIFFSIIVFGCIGSQGWFNEDGKEVCKYNGDANACNYGVGIAVISFLVAIGFVVLEYLFPNMSSIKTRRNFVMADLGFSGFWSFLYFVAFCYLASQWSKSEGPEAVASGNNLRAAIAFSFFSIISWAGSAYFAFQRYKQGSDSAFGSSFESGHVGVTTPGSGVGGYASDPIGGYQAPPFSKPGAGGVGEYQQPTY
uniref:Synaptogyrin n=1 Tax=Lynceus sp. MCZ IZ 141354 TaxID=1930659 RepID=A0A9N6WRN4_9CRUS|nr:EOG090X0FHR [Lynceus sp. MCZ IZ 141354]